jgi:hypothetical protein
MPNPRDSENVKEWAAQGGKARAAKLSPGERSQQARRAVQARWAKAGEAKVSLQFGGSPNAASEEPIMRDGGEVVVLSTGGQSCNLNSHSFVITPRRRERYTR